MGTNKLPRIISQQPLIQPQPNEYNPD